MRRKALSLVILFVSLVSGCKKNYNSKNNRMLSDLMKKDGLFSESDADRIEALIYEAKATGKLSDSDLKWVVGLLKNSDFTVEIHKRRMVYVDTILRNAKNFSSSSSSMREVAFNAGKNFLANTSKEDVVDLNYGISMIGNSGDPRGIGIITPYLNHPHWSVRKIAKTTILILKSKP